LAELPNDASGLDPKSKRAVTICNLFVNHKLAPDIVRLLNETRRGFWHYWSNTSSKTAGTAHKDHRMGRNNEGELRVSQLAPLICWEAL